MHFNELRPLGIGLAADLGGTQPDWRKFVDPRSKGPKFSYLNVAATWDQVDKVKYHVSDLVNRDFPFVMHPINLNPVDTELEPDHVINGVRELIEFTSSRWAATDVGVWMWENKYLGEFLIPVVLDKASATEVAEKARKLTQIFPCPFLLENPPVNFSVETMHMLDFMALVSQESGCGLVLDIGHLLGYQFATGRATDDMPLERFPFDRVVEIHLAGLMRRVSGGYETYYDHHGHPIHPLAWKFLQETIGRMSNLKAITLEQEFCEDSLVEQHLHKAREISRESAKGEFRAAV